MWQVPRTAIITTHNRPVQLDRLITALRPQVNEIVVVDNASDPPAVDDRVTVIRDEQQPPNLYRLWNVALDHVTANARHSELQRWDVGLFNDDADVPVGWFGRVADALRSTFVAACSTDAHGHVRLPLLKNAPDHDILTRMCPWAFVTRGELLLRADEDYGWWYGDTDFDWRCRLNGGVLVLPGDVVPNTCANSTTIGALAEQAGRDAETFRRKWGNMPW